MAIAQERHALAKQLIHASLSLPLEGLTLGSESRLLLGMAEAQVSLGADQYARALRKREKGSDAKAYQAIIRSASSFREASVVLRDLARSVPNDEFRTAALGDAVRMEHFEEVALQVEVEIRPGQSSHAAPQLRVLRD